MTACNADNFGKFFRPENQFVAKISKFCIIDMKIYPNFVREKWRQAMRIKKIWFEGSRIYAQFDDGRTLWQSLLYYRNLLNAENRDDYVIEDDGVHWYSLNEDISNESFEYDNPEPEGISRILLSHPELNLSAVARRLGIQQSLLAAYSSGMKRPSESRELMIVNEIRKIGNELLAIGTDNDSYGKPCSGYLAESREENYHSHTRTIVDGYDPDRNYGILRDGNMRDDYKNQSCVQTDDGLDEHKNRRSVKSLIKDGLIRNNMSQKALAEKMSVSPSRINAYVTGRAMPTLKMAAKLCKILEIAPGSMLQCQD